jgi:molybdopterin-containing oxidoreductase family iron-sulfur binding subunit
VKQPEDLVPGRPLFFATAVPFAGIAAPVLVESHEGHPTKVEGNPQHPASSGSTDIFTQAAILTLYDPDRLQTVLYRAEVRAWGEFLSAVKVGLAIQKGKQGAGLRFLSETVTSPSVGEQMALIQQAFPKAKWHQWDPVPRDAARAAAAQGAGRPVRGHLPLRQGRRRRHARLGLPGERPFGGPLFARLRRAPPRGRGRRARRRRRSRRGRHEPALCDREHADAHGRESGSPPGAARVGDRSRRARAVGRRARSRTPNAQKFLAAVAKDLQAHRGSSLVVAGDYQPASVHQLAHQLNQSLGNVGTTVTYAPAIEAAPMDQPRRCASSQAMDAGQVDMLVILGVEPGLHRAGGSQVRRELGKVALSISHTLYPTKRRRCASGTSRGARPRELGRRARVRRHRHRHAAADRAALRRRTTQEVLGAFIDAQTASRRTIS